MRVPQVRKQNIKIKNLQAIVQNIKEPNQKEQKRRKTSKKIQIIIKDMPICLCALDLKLFTVYNYIRSK